MANDNFPRELTLTNYPIDLSSDSNLVWGQDTSYNRLNLMDRAVSGRVTTYEFDLNNKFTNNILARPGFKILASHRTTTYDEANGPTIDYAKLTNYSKNLIGIRTGEIEELSKDHTGRMMHAKTADFIFKSGEKGWMIATGNATDTGLADVNQSSGYFKGEQQYNRYLGGTNPEVGRQISSFIDAVEGGVTPTSSENILVSSPKDRHTVIGNVLNFISKSESDLYIASATLTNKDVIGALMDRAAEGKHTYVGLGGLAERDMHANQGTYEMMTSDPSLLQYLHIGQTTRPFHSNEMASGDNFIFGSSRMSESALKGYNGQHGTEIMLYAQHKDVAEDIKQNIKANFNFNSAFVDRHRSKFSWLLNQFMPLNHANIKSRIKYVVDPSISNYIKQYAIEQGTIDQFERSPSLGTALYAALYSEINKSFEGASVPSAVSEFDRLAAKRTWGMTSWGLEGIPILGKVIKDWGGLRQIGNRGPVDSAIMRASMWFDQQIFPDLTNQKYDLRTGELVPETPLTSVMMGSYDLLQNTIGNIGGYYFMTLPMLRANVFMRGVAKGVVQSWAGKGGVVGETGKLANFFFGENWDRTWNRAAAEALEQIVLPFAKRTDVIFNFSPAVQEMANIYRAGGKPVDMGGGNYEYRPFTHAQAEKEAFQIADKALASNPLTRIISSEGIGRFFNAFNAGYYYDQAVNFRNATVAKTQLLLGSMPEGTKSTVLNVAKNKVIGNLLSSVSFGLLGRSQLSAAATEWADLVQDVNKKANPTYSAGNKFVGIRSAWGVNNLPNVIHLGPRSSTGALNNMASKVGASKALLDKLLRVQSTDVAMTNKFFDAYNSATGVDSIRGNAIKNTHSHWLRKGLVLGITAMYINRWAGEVGAAARQTVSTQERFKEEVNSLLDKTGHRREIDINWTGGLPEWATPTGTPLDWLTMPFGAIAYNIDKFRANLNTYFRARDIGPTSVAGSGVYGQAALLNAARAIANPNERVYAEGSMTNSLAARAAYYAQTGNYAEANALLAQARLGPGANVHEFSARDGMSIALQLDAMPGIATPTAALSFIGDRGMFSFSLQGPVMMQVGFTLTSPLGLKRSKYPTEPVTASNLVNLGPQRLSHLSFLKGTPFDFLSGYDIGYVPGTSGEHLFKLGVDVLGMTALARLANKVTGGALGNTIPYKLGSMVGAGLRFGLGVVPRALIGSVSMGANITSTVIDHARLAKFGFDVETRDDILKSWDPEVRAQRFKEHLNRLGEKDNSGKFKHVKSGTKLYDLVDHIDSSLQSGTGIKPDDFLSDTVRKNFGGYLKDSPGKRFKKFLNNKKLTLASLIVAGGYMAVDTGLSIMGKVLEGEAATVYRDIGTNILRATSATTRFIDQFNQGGILGAGVALASGLASVTGGLLASLFDVSYETYFKHGMMSKADFEQLVGDRDTYDDKHEATDIGWLQRRWNRFSKTAKAVYGGIADRFLGTSNLGAVFGNLDDNTTGFTKVYGQIPFGLATFTVATGPLGIRRKIDKSITMAGYVERAMSDPTRDERVNTRTKAAVVSRMFDQDSPAYRQSKAVSLQIQHRAFITNWITHTDPGDLALHFFMKSNEQNPLAPILDLSSLLPYIEPGKFGGIWRDKNGVFGNLSGNKLHKFMQMFESIRDHSWANGSLGEFDGYSGEYDTDSNSFAFDNPNGISLGDFKREIFMNPMYRGMFAGFTAVAGVLGAVGIRNILKGTRPDQLNIDRISEIAGGTKRVSNFGTVGISPTYTEAGRVTTARVPGIDPITGREAGNKFYERQAFVTGTGRDTKLHVFGSPDYKRWEYGNPLRAEGKIIGEPDFRKIKEVLKVGGKLTGGTGIKNLLVTLDLARPGANVKNPGKFARLDVTRALGTTLEFADDLIEALNNQEKMFKDETKRLYRVKGKNQLQPNDIDRANRMQKDLIQGREHTKKLRGAITNHTIKVGGVSFNVIDELRNLEKGLQASIKAARDMGLPVGPEQQLQIMDKFLNETHPALKRLSNREVAERLARSLQHGVATALHEDSFISGIGFHSLRQGNIFKLFGKTIVAETAKQGLLATAQMLANGPVDYIKGSWESARNDIIDRNRKGLIQSIDAAYQAAHAGISGANSGNLTDLFHNYLLDEQAKGNYISPDDYVHHYRALAMKHDASATMEGGAKLAEFDAKAREALEAYHRTGSKGIFKSLGTSEKPSWAQVAWHAQKDLIGKPLMAAGGFGLKTIMTGSVVGYTARNFDSVYALGKAADSDYVFRRQAAETAIAESRFAIKGIGEIAAFGLGLSAASAVKSVNKGMKFWQGFGATITSKKKIIEIAKAMKGARSLFVAGGLAATLGTGGTAALPALTVMGVAVASTAAVELAFWGLEAMGPLAKDKWDEYGKQHAQGLIETLDNNAVLRTGAKIGGSVWSLAQRTVDFTLGNLSGWANDPKSNQLQQGIGWLAKHAYDFFSWIDHSRGSGALYRPEDPTRDPSNIYPMLGNSPIWYGSFKGFAKHAIDNQERLMLGKPSGLINHFFGTTLTNSSGQFAQSKLDESRGTLGKYLKMGGLYSEATMHIMEARAIQSQFLLAGLNDRGRAFGGSDKDTQSLESGYFNDPYLINKKAMVFRSNKFGIAEPTGHTIDGGYGPGASSSGFSQYNIAGSTFSGSNKQLTAKLNRTMNNLNQGIPSQGLSGKDLHSKISKYATKHNVPLEVAYSLIAQESEGNWGAESGVGARGLIQLMPGTYKAYAAKLGRPVNSEAAFDVENNLDVGLYYLSQSIKAWKGNTSYGLAGYNAGIGSGKNAMDAQGPSNNPHSWVNETQPYVRNITAMIEIIKSQAIKAPKPGIKQEDIKSTRRVGHHHHPIHNRMAFHDGVDVAAAMGTPLFAPYQSKVVEAKSYQGYGQMITLEYVDIKGNKHRFSTAHLQTMDVVKGDTIEAGQFFGRVGSTGGSTGPHGHFIHSVWNPKTKKWELDEQLHEHDAVIQRTFGYGFAPVSRPVGKPHGPGQKKVSFNLDGGLLPKLQEIDSKTTDRPDLIAAVVKGSIEKRSKAPTLEMPTYKGQKVTKKVKTIKHIKATCIHDTTRLDNHKLNRLPKKVDPKVDLSGNHPVFSLEWIMGDQYASTMDNNYSRPIGPVRQDNHQR